MSPSLANVALAVALAGAVLAGCGPPPQPELPEPPAVPGATGPALPSPPVWSPPPPLTPLPPGVFPEDRAVDCDGNPDAETMVALLRAQNVLAAGVTADVSRGPLCAGSWQYAVVTVPDLDPLQVVTEGPPDQLALVTAGTDVCTVEVRVHAPPGIRAAAACVG